MTRIESLDDAIAQGVVLQDDIDRWRKMLEATGNTLWEYHHGAGGLVTHSDHVGGYRDSMEFVVAAHNEIVPRLLAEVERLRQSIADDKSRAEQVWHMLLSMPPDHQLQRDHDGTWGVVVRYLDTNHAFMLTSGHKWPDGALEAMMKILATGTERY